MVKGGGRMGWGVEGAGVVMLVGVVGVRWRVQAGWRLTAESVR